MTAWKVRAAMMPTASRCIFSLIASFSSPNCSNSPILPSSCLFFVAQRQHLPFGDRDGAPAMRVGHHHIDQQIGMFVEKTWIFLQITAQLLPLS
jgi:hypothetical protein